ncbi:Calmodulin binding protein PICBP, partial [Cucurbita argyrosperma subsp. sororia]
MVQRTAVGKFGVQIDGVKSEKRVASFKPSSSGSSSSSSSSQNTDGKNRAADLKMKMKKSRAIQLSDFESLASSPIRKNVTLPGKPPPSTVRSNVLEIKQKKNQQPSPIRTSGGSPNYMKSTSCFDARKEVSQVSSRKSRICNDSKRPRRRDLENSVAEIRSTRSIASAVRHVNPKQHNVFSVDQSDVYTVSDVYAHMLSYEMRHLRKGTFEQLSSANNVNRISIRGGANGGRDIEPVVSNSHMNDGQTDNIASDNLSGVSLSSADNTRSSEEIAEYEAESSSINAQNQTHEHVSDQPTEAASQHPMRTRLRNNIVQAKQFTDGTIRYSETSRKFASAPTKCLTRCPSVKLARTLTKTASFKKASRGALCADMNSHRATCSSTLKDTKFPAYLTLSPGATESEGTSTMKVCPYTYCSLNGHRHAPLPPLKCFLSARRRSLKTPKNLKVEPSGCGVQGDGAAGGKMVEALVNDGGLSFFIEIFAENEVDGASGASSSTVDDKAESSNEDNRKPVAVNISDESMDLHGDDYEDDAGSSGTEIEEWEEQQFLSMESDGLDELEDRSNVENGGLSEESRLHNEELVGSDVVVKDGKGVFFEEQFYMEDFELNRHPDWEVEEASQASESLSFDQLSYLEYAFDDMDATQAIIDRAETEYLDLILSSQLEAEVLNQDLQVDGAVLGSRASIHEEALQFDSHLPDHDRVLQEDSLDADIDIKNGKQLDDVANHGEEVSEDENSSEERHCQDISATGNINSVAEQDEETSLNDNSVVMVERVEGKDQADSSVKAAKSSRPAMNSSQELDLSGKNWELNINYKKHGDESEDPRSFNPQEPNYLPLAPDPEAEKVDLKHQLMDDRKNAEEWMLDYALQRTVTKLTPAKKKKVALLVEAFESVMPTTSRYEPHLQNNASGAFSPEKRIQACF